MIAASMLELVGQTPLVRIRGAWLGPASDRAATVWAKMEHLNPGGSVKDRICRAMIEDAEARGTLRPPGPIVPYMRVRFTEYQGRLGSSPMMKPVTASSVFPSGNQ